MFQSIRHAADALPAVLVITGALAGVQGAHAAGGHHAVDDAAILDAGQCQVEAWVDRQARGEATLLHLGPACRVGPLELGGQAQRRWPSEESGTTTGVQVKWARPVAGGVSAGVVIFAPLGQHVAVGAPRGALVLPISVEMGASILWHLNLGHDFLGGRDEYRAGIALEWTPSAPVSFVLERYRESGSHFWRLGARWGVTPTFSMDLSTARDQSAGSGFWTLGANWVFQR